MESKKINQLATSVSPQTSDLTIIGDPTTGVSKKITLLQIANLFATTGTVSSVAVTESGDALTITGSPITTAGTINIGFAGNATQYVRGDGALADFPTSTGGGSSVSYYLNSSVSQGTIGGVAYRELSKDPISGAGTDITISANGYVASYITDANDPALLEVPGGNFNCEFYFSVNSNAHNPYVYAELYKYDGTTFTLLGSSQSVPEYLTNGTTLSPYYFAIPVATAALTITDRLAIRIYVNVDTRTVTLHTENSHLCQVVTTFSKGLTSLNNLTTQVQFLATGTSGTDFNISSSTATHTFNIPNASATNRGLITTGAQTIAGAKVFDNPITGNSGIAFLNGVMPNITSNLYSGIGGNSQGISIITRPVSTNYTNNFYFPSASNSYTFPNATGTIALTSDISYPVTSVFGRTGAVVAASGDYTTTQVTEGTNLYYTDARSRAALSFTAGSGAYNSTTGVITIPTDNNQIANGAGYITSSALSGYLPLTGGTLTGGLNGTTATFSGLGTFYQLTMTGATAGRLFYAQTGGVFSQSGNLVWNNSTEQLGVGTPNPSAVVTAFSTNAATQLKAAGTAPAITFSNTLTSASLACVFGLATANNHFVTGTAAGDMAIANQSTSPGAIIFGTDTFEKMRMSSNGNFGIATSSPATKLDVSGTIRSISQTDPTSGVGMELFYRAADTSSYIQSYDRTNGAWRDVKIYGNTLYFGSQGTNNLTIATTGAATFSSSVTAGGSSLFNANNGTLSADILTIKGGGGTGAFGFRVEANNGQAIFRTNNFSYNVLMCENGGNVGIGTSAPTTYGLSGTHLDVSGGANFSFIHCNTTTVKSFLASNESALLTALFTFSNHPLTFGTANTERARITSGGNVQIGGTTGSDSRLYIKGVSATSSNNALLIHNGSGSDLFFIRNDGVVYTGTAALSPYNLTTANSANLFVASDGGLLRSTSSLKYKKNVKNYTKGLAEVMQLRAVTYQGKNDRDNDKQFAGLIAEEVHELGLTEFVQYAEDGSPDALAYQNMIALAFKAIQELTQKVNELESKIK